jgi:hypothetical protein
MLGVSFPAHRMLCIQKLIVMIIHVLKKWEELVFRSLIIIIKIKRAIRSFYSIYSRKTALIKPSSRPVLCIDFDKGKPSRKVANCDALHTFFKSIASGKSVD